jgi:hypothetical protein
MRRRLTTRSRRTATPPLNSSVRCSLPVNLDTNMFSRRALVYLAACLVFGFVGVYFSYPIPCSKLGPSALLGGIFYGSFSLFAFFRWAKFVRSSAIWLSVLFVFAITSGLCGYFVSLLLRDPSLVCAHT